MIQFDGRFRLLLFIFAALVILGLSVMPNPPVPQSGILSWDKAQHAFAYAFLMILGGWAFLPMTPSRLDAWRYALFIVVGYGALMEGAQALLTRGRSGDLADILANALGGLVIYIPIWLLYCRKFNGGKEKR
ncbi:VanZ family protein [Syntrophotalea acetylenivorans]|nr:VanZ family protein [Syntrophotalea acetylenivorans]